MDDRSEEIIKQLNRLTNDRTLTPGARNKLHMAVQHIKVLRQRLREADAGADQQLDIYVGARTNIHGGGVTPTYHPLESMLPQSRNSMAARQ